MIVVTNRDLCSRPFLAQLESILKGHPEMVILREKSLTRDELLPLACDCLALCEQYEVPLSVNGDLDAARELDICRVHLPLPVLRTADLTGFTMVGASVHSPEEAVEAESLGADYLIAGHVFETACKPFEPRGLDFLRRVCEAVDIPVYGIGGISPANVGYVAETGAAGVCSMSGIMASEDPQKLISDLTAPFCRYCFLRRNRYPPHGRGRTVPETRRRRG